MVHSNRGLTSYFYETVCQGLCRTSQFIKPFVKGCPGQTVLWHRTTESHGVSHVCKLKTNLISFLGWRAQAVDYDRTFSWHWVWHSRYFGGRAFVFYLWCLTTLVSTTEREWSRQERQVFQVMLAALWPEPADPASFILSRSHDNYVMVTWQLCNSHMTVM